MYQTKEIDDIISGRNAYFASKVKPKVLAKAEYQEGIAHTLCITGIDAPFGNAVWQLPQCFTNEDEIRKVINIFRDKELPFFWWESPLAMKLKDENTQFTLRLKNILIENGLQIGGILTGIITCLDSVRAKMQLPSEISIRPVESLSDLHLFCRLIFSIHGTPPHVMEQAFLLAEHSMQAKEEINYLAYRNNQPIGGITLSIGKTIAGLWSFATLPDHRNLGVGSALIQTALMDAKERGYQNLMAILMPNQIGKLWRQYHFQEICHFPFYIGQGKMICEENEKSKRVIQKNLF